MALAGLKAFIVLYLMRGLHYKLTAASLMIGGAAVTTMAYAILMPLTPEDEHGALTGFYSLSRGVGITLGPILAGILVALSSTGPFAATKRFRAMFIVCACAALTSLLFVRRLQRSEDDRRELENE
jgi:MFS family permease